MGLSPVISGEHSTFYAILIYVLLTFLIKLYLHSIYILS